MVALAWASESLWITQALSLLQRLSMTKSWCDSRLDRKLSKRDARVSTAIADQGLGTPNEDTTNMSRLGTTTLWNRRFASTFVDAWAEWSATLKIAVTA